MKYIFIIGVLLTFCVTDVSAQSKKSALVWKTGKIMDKQLDSKDVEVKYTRMENGRDEEKTINGVEATQRIMLKTDEITYFLSRRVAVFWDKSLKFEKDMPVSYAIDGEFMYLRNAKGKKFKYTIGNVFKN